MPSVRSAGGRAPPRANSISGCRAARPLPLLSRRAPPRPALSGTRPGHAPAWALPLGHPCRMVLSRRPSKTYFREVLWGLLSVLPIKLAPLGWGRARTFPLRNSAQGGAVSQRSFNPWGGWDGNKQAPLDVACVNHYGYPPRGLCGSHYSQSPAVIAGSSCLRQASAGIQAWTLSHWLEREVWDLLINTEWELMGFINQLA